MNLVTAPDQLVLTNEEKVNCNKKPGHSQASSDKFILFKGLHTILFLEHELFSFLRVQDCKLPSHNYFGKTLLISCLESSFQKKWCKTEKTMLIKRIREFWCKKGKKVAMEIKTLRNCF